MFLAMILAHLVGDYILQWNQLAVWKSREFKGVVVHALIVSFVTWLFAQPFQETTTTVLIIASSHFMIDAGQFFFKSKMNPLWRFALDQLAHFAIIIAALVVGGYIEMTQGWLNWGLLLTNNQIMPYLLAYAFLTMPAWVIIKFLVFGLTNSSAPNFIDQGKYLSMMERLLVATFVLIGQFFLLPLIVAPRLALEWRNVANSEKSAVYLTEWLVSIFLAVTIGLWLNIWQG